MRTDDCFSSRPLPHTLPPCPAPPHVSRLVAAADLSKGFNQSRLRERTRDALDAHELQHGTPTGDMDAHLHSTRLSKSVDPGPRILRRSAFIWAATAVFWAAVSGRPSNTGPSLSLAHTYSFRPLTLSISRHKLTLPRQKTSFVSSSSGPVVHTHTQGDPHSAHSP